MAAALCHGLQGGSGAVDADEKVEGVLCLQDLCPLACLQH